MKTTSVKFHEMQNRVAHVQEKPNWQMPESLPDLSDAKVIAFDLETRDPNLLEEGPGTFRKDGYPVGVSVWTDTGKGGYFPFKHDTGPNLDQQAVCTWLGKELGREVQTKVGANTLYDLEWLRYLGVNVRGPISDVQVIEALIDEERDGYSLEKISASYLGEGKSEHWIHVGMERIGKKAEEAKSLLWMLPAEYVGEYAETDAIRTLQVYLKQLPILEAQSLQDVYKLETDLIPLILEMRFQGVRVDINKAQQIADEWRATEKELYNEMHRITGLGTTNVWSAEEIRVICDKLSIEYNRTPKTNAPSFPGAWLEKHPHPFLQTVVKIRSINRLRTKFLEHDVIQNSINGRIHCQFHPMRRDEGGTRSGRFSSSKPNLQQVPNVEHSPDAWKIRSVFLPNEGERWAKLDYSQQEPRILVHYAATLGLQGAEAALQVYQSDVKADFYQIIVELTGVSRSQAKMIYLARTYGLGKTELARKLGVSLDEAKEIAETMDARCPFIKEMGESARRAVSLRGSIRTVGGRVCHFTKFELAKWSESQEAWKNGDYPLLEEDAKEFWKGKELKRSGLHKALNRLIQGSAADMTKRAMVNAWKRHKIVPLLQVHDELDISYPGWVPLPLAMKDCMENAYELEVPIYADLKTGENWGEVK